MPRTQRIIAQLPDMTGLRLAFSVHLEIKMVPLFEALLERGAKLFLTTCNPTTVRDEIVAHLQARGAEAEAQFGMLPEQVEQAIEHALDWQPTHLIEMGADLTIALHQRESNSTVRASLEGTGSGIARLQNLRLRYPIFNWDDLPIKEGLHNRYMVGLTTWQAFFERTRLSLHEKRVLVIGFGSVGRGVAEAARAFGGTVCIADCDPMRALQAAYAGWSVKEVQAALPEADVVVTATGASHVLRAEHFILLRDGAFLLNVGHCADEIDLTTLRWHEHTEALPFVETFHLDQRTIYLFAGGSMANLTAGKGDSLNSFDLTLAVLTAGIGHLVTIDETFAPTLQMLPQLIWEQCLVSFVS